MLDEDAVNKLSDELDLKVKEINVGKKYAGITNDTSVGKCFSCERSWIIRIARQNDPIVRCAGDVVPHDIIECSKYERKGEVNIWDLIKMHNPVDLSKPEKVVGFSKDDESTETPSV
jgi:hypothetical protein